MREHSSRLKAPYNAGNGASTCTYKVKEVSSMLVCAEEQKNDQPKADQELQQLPCAVTPRVTPATSPCLTLSTRTEHTVKSGQ